MADTTTYRCHYCGYKEETFVGSMEPADPSKTPIAPPPGSGFFTVWGPTMGSGYPDEPRTYCTRAHMGLVEVEGKAPLAAAEEVKIIKGWVARKPKKDR